MPSLSQKTVIITGSSRGIGAALAKAMAAAGARVIVNYAGRKDAAQIVVEEIESKGGEAIAVQADIIKVGEVKALFEQAEARFGKVDILVNNAGVVVYKLLVDTTDEDFERLMSINVRGVFNTMREAATRLADGGRIINFSTTVTRMMLPTYGIYAASKGAVEQLTRDFAKEVGSRGITVNAISPGPTNTELFYEGKSEETIKRMAALSALGRIGEPEDIAKVAIFLASDEAGWVTGQILPVNGGVA